ncbi:MAG: Fic family protein [Clostridia bacterium]|nr:Fic family protein [Clostridia bacterium]
MTNLQIMGLINEKNLINQRLNSLIYGTIEIREKDEKSYIYVHYRENGVAYTKYVGAYSAELHNLILKNTAEAKMLKKSLKNIEKQLREAGVFEEELDKNIELNIDLAKRYMVENIYDQAVLEGVATTYLDTETIIEGGKVNNMKSCDVSKIINLKHAWEFILNKAVITSPTNLGLLCEINKIVEEGFYYNAGKVRSTPVHIGGTNWMPELPIESVVREEIDEILSLPIATLEKGIYLLLYVMKKQVFLDGNKRTAVIFANHFLIANGTGLIVIPSVKVEEFRTLLIEYYENNNEKIVEFLKKHCIITLN